MKKFYNLKIGGKSGQDLKIYEKKPSKFKNVRENIKNCDDKHLKF